jgi:hypothetical protein
MSEYQYYEFRAIDRPLTEKQMEELRRLSTRAEITPTSFTNEYHWGNFKGSPRKLMHEYFDAFVYVANWGTHQLMFRIPGNSLDIATTRGYQHRETLEIDPGKDHVVLDFGTADDEPPDDWEAGERRMPSLMPIRADLMRGDHRALYLGWLAGIQTRGGYDEDEDVLGGDELEPPVPPGLGKLSGSLRALADFLRIDDELIAVAAEGSQGEVPAGPSRDDMKKWVKSLPAVVKDDALVRFLAEEGDLALRAELLRMFRDDTRPEGRPGASGSERRTVAQLLAARNALIAENRRKAAEKSAREKARREREQAEARRKYLDELAGRVDKTWEEVESLIATKQPGKYDQAVELLADLRELARRSGKEEAFQSRVGQLRERHKAKTSLRERLDRSIALRT